MSKYALAHRRSLAVVAAAAVLALTAGGGAVAGSLITSKDIQDKTITGADLHKNAVKTQKVKDGTLKIQDLNKKAQDLIKPARPGRQGRQGRRHVEGHGPRDPARRPREARGHARGAGRVRRQHQLASPARVRTIVDAHTVRLVLAAGNAAGTSVEIQNLDLPVQATKTVSFTYKLENGAAYSAGAPRVLIEIGGTFYNTVRRRSRRRRHVNNGRTAPSTKTLDHPGQRPASAPPASSTTTRLRSERSP